MTKDGILEGIANYLEARRVAAELGDVIVRPQKSVLGLPETGSLVVVSADDLEHGVGHYHRLEPLRLRVQTAGLGAADTAAHKAAMGLCRAAVPDVESAAHPAAFAALAAAIVAVEPDVSLSFWFVQGEREAPIEGEQWWEDQLVVRVGVTKG